MSSTPLRAEVCGIKMKAGFGFSETNKVMYVGYTTRDPNTFLNEFKNMLKNGRDEASHKIQALGKIDLTKLEVVFLGKFPGEQIAEKVNYYISKYDTLENGWNSVLR